MTARTQAEHREGLEARKDSGQSSSMVAEVGTTTRKVYFDQLFGTRSRTHSYWWEYINYPPDGYDFVLSNTRWDSVVDRLVTRNQLIEGNLRLVGLLNKLVAPRLAKAYLDRMLKRPPQCDLVFSTGGHIPLYKKPWVILLMAINTLTGLDVKHLRKHKGTIERHFASDYCKRIVIWWEATRKALLANFDCCPFEHKIEMVPPAYHSQHFAKSYNNEKVKLLFIGSANVPRGIVSKMVGSQYFYEFDGKGGREVLRAFRLLRERYANVELVMRAGVPPDLRRQFEGIPGLTLIEAPIPEGLLAEEFKSADVFIYPSHQPMATTVLLEAMSYELPIVALDVYAYPELVQDGVTGLLVKPSDKVPYYWDNMLVSMGSPLQGRYMEGIKAPDPRVVEELVGKTSMLIANPELRRRMGKAARQEIDSGRHSLKKVNAKLKRIFDEALES
jgi:glycosyltransferase involved in cell wall biosynthesis